MNDLWIGIIIICVMVIVFIFVYDDVVYNGRDDDIDVMDSYKDDVSNYLEMVDDKDKEEEE